jgi:hypothetical protein
MRGPKPTARQHQSAIHKAKIGRLSWRPLSFRLRAPRLLKRHHRLLTARRVGCALLCAGSLYLDGSMVLSDLAQRHFRDFAHI